MKLLLAAMMLTGLAACGGVVGATSGDGGLEAAADVTIPPEASIDGPPETSIDGPGVDVQADAGNDAGGFQSYHCPPGEGVLAEAGPDLGNVGCATMDGGALELLTNFASWPQHIAVDDANLYWAESDGVVKADKGGTPVAKFCVPQGTVQAFVEDGTSLYVATYDSQSRGILQIPTSGGNWSQLAMLTAWPTRLSTDATIIYWLEQDSQPSYLNFPVAGRIGTVQKTGTGQQILVMDTGLDDARSDGTRLFWLTGTDMGGFFDTVKSLVLSQPSQTMMVAQTTSLTVPSSFGMDGARAYWADTANTAARTGAVWSVRKDGTSLTQLASSSHPAYGLLVDGSIAYWGEDAIGRNGTLFVHKLDVNTGASAVLLAKPTSYMGVDGFADVEQVLDFATDATALYFTTVVVGNPGSLYKICK